MRQSNIMAQEHNMHQPEHHLMWNMTRRCNFKCKYCYFPHQSQPEPNPITADEIGDFLDNSGHGWIVEMTGGEPFLYPGFVEVCSRITQNHLISLDSNLSISKEVRRFAHSVDPAKVVDIYAAVHIEERRRLGLVERFVEDVRLLMDKGFQVSLNYVIHPSLVRQYPKDREYFMNRGIKLLPRPFKGRHNGVDYPAGYGQAAKSLFAKKLKAGKKAVFNFKGVPCDAGMRLLRLEPDRSILRCSGDRTRLGSLGGELKLHTSPQPCRVSRCPCFGPDYVRLDTLQKVFMDGLTHLLAGDPAGEAPAKFEKVLKTDPQASHAMNNLAVILHRRDETRAALELLEKAAAQNPYNKTYVLNAAACLAGAGDLESGLGLCRMFLARHGSTEVEHMAGLLEAGKVPEFPGLICVDLVAADNPQELYLACAES
jgi:hypothetical protein